MYEIENNKEYPPLSLSTLLLLNSLSEIFDSEIELNSENEKE